MNRVRIAILDPHELVVAGFTSLLCTASSAYEVVPLVLGEGHPDVVLYSLEEDGAADHDPQLHTLLRSQPVTVIATCWDEGSSAIRTALACGAHGVLSKRLPAADLLSGIQRVLDGGDPVSSPPMDGTCDPEIVRAGLTPRELDVLGLVGAGLTNRELADQLHLSINSVKTYIRSAYAKIGAERRAQAVIWVERHGLTAPSTSVDPRPVVVPAR